MVSGGFDPIHIGHVRMILQANRMGPVIVALNSDAWLLRKKGFVFMPFEERKEILMAIRGVSQVVAFDDSDDTACDAIKRFKPDYFANGGDRVSDNTPEVNLCNDMNVGLLWNVGRGGKVQSSSALAAAAK